MRRGGPNGGKKHPIKEWKSQEPFKCNPPGSLHQSTAGIGSKTKMEAGDPRRHQRGRCRTRRDIAEEHEVGTEVTPDGSETVGNRGFRSNDGVVLEENKE